MRKLRCLFFYYYDKDGFVSCYCPNIQDWQRATTKEESRDLMVGYIKLGTSDYLIEGIEQFQNQGEYVEIEVQGE